MATDIYLFIEGIKGESSDAAHKDWMEVKYVDLGGVSQPRSATCSTSGGHTAGRCHHHTIVVAKQGDLASPILMQTCAMGKTLPKARLEFFRADGNGKPICYYEVELENAMIAEVAASVDEGDPITEYVALAFSKVKWTYTMQKIGGGAAGCTVGGWDLAGNCIA
jgi:type VI secretion system secreted protein Hcp